jgi:hypothetical protein
MDCSNYDYRCVEATTCIWRERENTVVTGSMRRRSDTTCTCIDGMERQQAKMSIALGGAIECELGFGGGDMAPRFLQTLHCALAVQLYFRVCNSRASKQSILHRLTPSRSLRHHGPALRPSPL